MDRYPKMIICTMKLFRDSHADMEFPQLNLSTHFRIESSNASSKSKLQSFLSYSREQLVTEKRIFVGKYGVCSMEMMIPGVRIVLI